MSVNFQFKDGEIGICSGLAYTGHTVYHPRLSNCALTF